MRLLIVTGMLAIFLLLLSCTISSSGDCPISICTSGAPVRFPFVLEGRQAKNCGYPGFDLRCNDQNNTVLTLPYSGDFLVRKINYLTQQIQLYDLENCLARRLLRFNLSGSPFVATAYQNYTFLSCPTESVGSLTTIPCLSNSTTSILAFPSLSFATSEMSSCTILFTLPIPLSWRVQYAGGFTNDLNDDLQLTWYTPNCHDCEAKGGICGYKGTTNQEIGCSHDPPTGSANGLQIFKVICVSIAIPVILFATGISLIAYLVDRRPRVSADSRWRSSMAVVVPPTQGIVMTGLDDSTIESYQKVVLGESKRLPGPNDTTCAICLSEYCTKDTIRCIPECNHCFHANCIDQWLRMNSSCPVCRNSPSPAPAESESN